MIGISKLYCRVDEPSDALRYGGHPAEARKPVVVWNCTRRCNLSCMHCYSLSENRRYADELTTARAEALLEDLAAFGVPVVLFSGGEPLMRPDILGLIARAAGLGMRAVLSTNGTLIDIPTAERLRDSGLSYVGVSLDGMRRTHDAFRGAAGAFDRALAGIRHCCDAGLKVGLHFTINQRNAPEVGDIFTLSSRPRTYTALLYHLVYTGRGAALMAEDPDRESTRRLVDLIIDRTADLHARGLAKEVLTVDNHCDGPYLYLRLLREDPERHEEVMRLLRLSGGNSSGSRIGCVSWDGSVHADQFWRHVSFGNVTERPFSEIWQDLSHPLMAKLRDKRPHLKGRCATCRFLEICGGNCRVRAEAATGDASAPDPACYLTDEEIARPQGSAERPGE